MANDGKTLQETNILKESLISDEEMSLPDDLFLSSISSLPDESLLPEECSPFEFFLAGSSSDGGKTKELFHPAIGSPTDDAEILELHHPSNSSRNYDKESKNLFSSADAPNVDGGDTMEFFSPCGSPSDDEETKKIHYLPTEFTNEGVNVLSSDKEKTRELILSAAGSCISNENNKEEQQSAVSSIDEDEWSFANTDDWSIVGENLDEDRSTPTDFIVPDIDATAGFDILPSPFFGTTLDDDDVVCNDVSMFDDDLRIKDDNNNGDVRDFHDKNYSGEIMDDAGGRFNINFIGNRGMDDTPDCGKLIWKTSGPEEDLGSSFPKDSCNKQNNEESVKVSSFMKKNSNGEDIKRRSFKNTKKNSIKGIQKNSFKNNNKDFIRSNKKSSFKYNKKDFIKGNINHNIKKKKSRTYTNYQESFIPQGSAWVQQYRQWDTDSSASLDSLEARCFHSDNFQTMDEAFDYFPMRLQTARKTDERVSGNKNSKRHSKNWSRRLYGLRRSYWD